MGIPRVASCCCGCTVETGTKIIGCVEIIFAILLISLSSISIELLDNNNVDLTQNEIDLLYGVLVALIVISAIRLLISGLLLWGATQAKPHLMKPWLIFAIINVLMTFISLIVNIVVASGSSSSSEVVSSITSSALSIFLDFYFFVVVYSHFKNLTEAPMQNIHNFARAGV